MQNFMQPNILISFREEIQIVWVFFPKVNQYIRLHENSAFFSYGIGEEIQISLNTRGMEGKEFNFQKRPGGINSDFRKNIDP